MGKKYMEREGNEYFSLSFHILFSHFSPWGKLGKHTFFHGQKWCWTPPTSLLQKSSCRVSNEKNILNSSVEWSRVEWKNWIKVISLFTFSNIFCLLSILSYEARMIIDIHTCVIRKSQSLTYCFLFININTVTRGAHDIRTCVLWEFLTLTYCVV